MTFSERLVDLLHLQGKTQKELANGVNVAPTVVSNWIKRNSIPAADTAIRAADYLHVSVRFLVLGEEEKEQFTRLDEDFLKRFKRLPEAEQKEVRRIVDLKLEKCFIGLT